MLTDQQCEEICRTYYKEILCFCLLKLPGSEADAEDLAQTVFLTLVQKKHRLRDDGSLRAWLYRTAENLLRNYARVHQNDSKIVPFDDAHMPVQPVNTDSAAELLHTLSEDEYSLLTAYYLERESKDKIAARLHITRAQLYDKVRWIRKKLRAIAEHGEEGSA